MADSEREGKNGVLRTTNDEASSVDIGSDGIIRVQPQNSSKTRPTNNPRGCHGRWQGSMGIAEDKMLLHCS
jgi:hypothetical protein